MVCLCFHAKAFAFLPKAVEEAGKGVLGDSKLAFSSDVEYERMGEDTSSSSKTVDTRFSLAISGRRIASSRNQLVSFVRRIQALSSMMTHHGLKRYVYHTYSSQRCPDS